MRPSPVPRGAGTRVVSHDVAGGSGRATVVRSAGDGARAVREGRACLGRVVDRARGACRSKARGLFPCALATGEFGPAPEGVEGPRGRSARAAGTALAVSLGDAFPPGSLLRPGGLMACADACGHAEPDTVRARPASYVPAGPDSRHARDRVERVFEIAGRGGRALPACVQTEEALGGHLPVCLVATAATRVMSDVLASRRTSPAVESMPGAPRERHATGRDGRPITTEPVRKTSEAHGAFGIRCPDTIRLPVVG